MTDADELIAQQRFAFRMAPQIVEDEVGWRAQYPGAGWSVVGSTAEEAGQRLAEEVTRRRNAGEDPMAFQNEVYRRHLEEPVVGVWAMDSQLYRHLVLLGGYDQDSLQPVFEEAERRRALGQSFTKEDYLAQDR